MQFEHDDDAYYRIIFLNDDFRHVVAGGGVSKGKGISRKTRPPSVYGGFDADGSPPQRQGSTTSTYSAFEGLTMPGSPPQDAPRQRLPSAYEGFAHERATGAVIPPARGAGASPTNVVGPALSTLSEGADHLVVGMDDDVDHDPRRARVPSAYNGFGKEPPPRRLASTFVYEGFGKNAQPKDSLHLRKVSPMLLSKDASRLTLHGAKLRWSGAVLWENVRTCRRVNRLIGSCQCGCQSCRDLFVDVSRPCLFVLASSCDVNVFLFSVCRPLFECVWCTDFSLFWVISTFLLFFFCCVETEGAH